MLPGLPTWIVQSSGILAIVVASNVPLDNKVLAGSVAVIARLIPEPLGQR